MFDVGSLCCDMGVEGVPHFSHKLFFAYGTQDNINKIFMFVGWGCLCVSTFVGGCAVQVGFRVVFSDASLFVTEF